MSISRRTSYDTDVSVSHNAATGGEERALVVRSMRRKKRILEKGDETARWKKRLRAGRSKNEIRSGPAPAFAFKLLYNCILRGTKSDGDLRDVITDERLYKKLPILHLRSLASLRVSHFLLFAPPPDRSLLQPSLPGEPPSHSLCSSKRLVFAVSRSGG